MKTVYWMCGVALLTLFAMLYAGCAGTDIGDLVDKWQGENPALVGVVLLDEDGDLVGDVAIEVDAKGKILRNPDGSYKEVPGSRNDIVDYKLELLEQIRAAAETDAGISSELILWGTAIGGVVGGVVLKVGKVWGRREPLKELVIAQQNFKEVVFNIERFKEDATPANWDAVFTGVSKLSKQARAAMEAALEERTAAKTSAETVLDAA